MARGRTATTYEVAHLAGGRERVVDTALAALVERGAVRVRRSGALDAVHGAADSADPVEQAVLETVRARTSRSREAVLRAARTRPELIDLADRLVRDGLVQTGLLARLLGPPARLTPDGRQLLAAAGRTPAGSWAAAVALTGLGALPDRAVRDALVGRATRPWLDGGAGWSAVWGDAGGGSHGGSHSSCGGSSSCGGGGCGGGGS